MRTGSPPIQRGRPMTLFCQPNKTEDGTDSNWGTVDPDLLYNPEYGWCMADRPKHHCSCDFDGWGGEFCDVPYEQTCLNQCNGHGECLAGFCSW